MEGIYAPEKMKVPPVASCFALSLSRSRLIHTAPNFISLALNTHYVYLGISVYLLVALLTLLASLTGGGRTGQVPICANYHFFRAYNKECLFCLYTATTSHI